MPEMTMTEAAAALGVSVGTIRRRIQRGDLQARQDERGRYLIRVDLSTPTSPPSPTAEMAAELARLRLQLEHEREMLAEVRRQRDELAVLLDAQRAQLEAIFEAQARADEERAELRRLLGNAQMQLSALLPTPRQVEGQRSETERRTAQESNGQGQAKGRRWWWPWKRG